MWRPWLLILCTLTVISAEDSPVLVGKIVAVDNPNIKRDFKNKNRNQVFATRALSFLKQNGDVFKVHRPGLMGAEKTVSFESMRLPGFYLRQKNNRIHLDNLQSKYIKKDATFLESKDPVGETFRLFMHHDKFLCHEPNGGFNLFMQKDSASRDTLNCAFNIVPSGQDKAKQKESNTTQNVEVQSLKALVNKIKGKKDPFKKSNTSSLIVINENVGDTSMQNQTGPASVLNVAAKPGTSHKPQRNASANNKKAANKIDHQSNGTVLPPAGLGKNVPMRNKLKVVKSGSMPNKVAINGVKDKHKGFIIPPAGPGKLGAKVPSGKEALPIHKAASGPKVGYNQGSIFQQQQMSRNLAMPYTGFVNRPAMNPRQNPYSPFLMPSPYQNSFTNPRMRFPGLNMPQFQNSFNPLPQPVNINNGFFKPAGNRWVAGNPTKKVMISNAAGLKKAIQLPAVYPRLPSSPYLRNTLQGTPNNGYYFTPNYGPGFPQQVRPLPKQQIAHYSSFQSSQVENNPGKLQIQYVPPQQWGKVVNFHQVNSGTLPVQMQSTYSKETHASSISNPVSHDDLNMYSTDNLLSKLHPELSLDHSANHDVNDISSTATQLHHIVAESATPIADDHHTIDAINSHNIETVDAASTVNPTPNIGLHTSSPVASLSGAEHHIVSHLATTHDVGTEVVSPLTSTPHLETHIDAPITSTDSSTLKPEPIHILHEPEVSSALLHSNINTQAANSLVHTNPDITLQEAFNKMNPVDMHPIEITSEPVHHILNEPESGKAFHMRTHYVSGKPVNMDGNDAMKEVHVVHHDHHIIHEANDKERAKFLSSLMDESRDLCISLVFINQLGSRYRLVSTINPHGYRPRGARFSLKTIFKDPNKRKVMSFKAYDEANEHNNVLLNGHKELNILPTPCSNPVVNVIVDSINHSSATVIGKRRDSVKAPDTSGTHPNPKPATLTCPQSCSNECGKGCPMACCSDASSSLLH